MAPGRAQDGQRQGEVVVAPFLVSLREAKEAAFARGQAKPIDCVFASEAGTPLGFRNIVRRRLEPALRRAVPEPIRWHDLRHCYASLLIGGGADVFYASRQLGHANPAITLSVYSHLWEREAHADRTRDQLEAGFGHLFGRDQR